MSESSTPWLALDRAAWGQALRLAIAAWLAFAIASALHVHNAYWAAMPVWVVAQSSRGLLLERAFYRVVGTLGGAACGFGILQLTGDPWLQLVALGLIAALGAGFTHILRGVHSYGAMMVGMTAAIVVLPSVYGPDHAYGIASARVECTLIGVVVVTLVMGMFTPTSRRDVFYQRVRQLAGDAVAFAAMAVEGRSHEDTRAFERRVLANMSDVDALSSMVSAGSIEGYRRLRHVNALVMASMSVMAAARAVRARQGRGDALPDALVPWLHALMASLHTGSTATRPVKNWRHDSPELARLARGIADLLAAESALFAETSGADAQSFRRKVSYLAPHRDWALARRTGAVAGVSTFVAGALAFLSGHAVAELAALGVCIFSIVLGSLPMPQKAAPQMFAGVVSGLVLATLYRFFVQPQVTSLVILVVTVIPFIAIGAIVRANPRTAIVGIDTNMCFWLASQASMPAAGALEILTGSAALLIGAGVVMGGFILLPRRYDLHAREVARTLLRDLERLIGAGTATERSEWHPNTARQILRLMLHASRAGGRFGNEVPDGLLAMMNLAYAVGTLQSAEAEPGGNAAASRALIALGSVTSKPLEAADDLVRQATSLPNGEVRRAIEWAADCIRAALPIFRFAGA